MSEKLKAFLAEPLFRNCSPQDISRFLPSVKEEMLSSGQTLFMDGKPATRVFLLVAGEVKLAAKGRDDRTATDGTLGEEAALGFKHYTMTATAVSDARLLAMPKEQFGQLLAKYPGLKDGLLQSYALRFHALEAGGAEQQTVAADQATAGVRQAIGWLLATIVPIAVFFFLKTDPTISSEQSRYFLAIISSVAVMWIFQLVADFIPAMFAILAIILLGLSTPATVLSGFASNGFFMAMSVLGLGTLIRGSGLGYRVLLLLLRVRPASRMWHNCSVFSVGFLLTPIVPTANGRVAVVAPFVQEILESTEKKDYQPEAAALSISALSGVSLFSSSFLSSKSINFIVFGALPAQEQAQFNWFHWFVAASFCSAVLLALYLASFSIVFKSRNRSTLTRAIVDEQLTALGPLQKTEWAALFGMLVFAGSLATSAIHRIDLPWVALSILFGLLIFGFLSKSEFQKKIDWPFLFFLGSLVGLVDVMKEVNVDKWLTLKFVWLNGYMADNFPLFIVMLAVALFLVRLLLPINATVVIFATLLIPTAVNIGVNPWLVGFLILFFAESFVLPYQASYYMQYCSITGVGLPSQDRRIIPFHLGLIAIKLAAVYASLPFWKGMGLL